MSVRNPKMLSRLPKPNCFGSGKCAPKALRPVLSPGRRTVTPRRFGLERTNGRLSCLTAVCGI